jgi:hypothetical protein
MNIKIMLYIGIIYIVVLTNCSLPFYKKNKNLV